MKIEMFGKEIEIDENNKGINFFLKNMGEPIDEITTVFRYRMRYCKNNSEISSEEAAEHLLAMSAAEFKNCIFDNIRDSLEDHTFSEEYASYVK